MLFQSLFCTLKFLSFFDRLRSNTSPPESPPKVFLQSLPNELLLQMFSFLELKPYILCHGVCKTWHHLLPSTKMDPTCRRLLDLYHRVLNTPDFEKTLEWTSQHLHLFERQEYICCLLRQYPALVYKQSTPSRMFIPGLFIWRDATESDWLIFEKDEPGLFGKVIVTDDYWHSFGGIPYYPSLPPDNDPNDEDSSESEFSEGKQHLITFQDWIVYLNYQWSLESVQELQHPSGIFLEPDHPIVQPVRCMSNGSGYGILPANAWASSQRTIQCPTS